mmetsp:Transcript_6947/g.16889  ORF Transcript_6947/g.16889 Transcript_6947/m.16889 type:complete len:229 (+) Transcript_6947:2147-2833(+)
MRLLVSGIDGILRPHLRALNLRTRCHLHRFLTVGVFLLLAAHPRPVTTAVFLPVAQHKFIHWRSWVVARRSPGLYVCFSVRFLQLFAIDRNLGAARRAHLLHHQPGFEAVHVEYVAARQDDGAFVQIIATNDAGFRIRQFLRIRHPELVLEVRHYHAVLPEVPQPGCELPRDLHDVCHHVDGQPVRILEEEDAHEAQENEHRAHVAHELQIKDVRSLPRPPVFERSVD